LLTDGADVTNSESGGDGHWESGKGIRELSHPDSRWLMTPLLFIAVVVKVKVTEDRQKGPVLSKAFLADLESVFERDASDDIPIEDLKDLGEKLEKSRKYLEQELSNELSKLPMDHPVRCPISLYGVMEVGRLEVAHTRTLAWLLNPKNTEHGFGELLLKALLKHICKCNDLLSFDVCEVHAERAYRDFITEEAGRTDVWVEGHPTSSRPWLVVIEAKIDASEGDQQLDRYNREIRKWRARHRDGEIHRVFLTPNGREPKSVGKWTLASFSQLVRVFWGAACSRTADPGFHFLRYYLAGVLKDVVRLPIGLANVQRNPYRLLEFLRGAYTSR
jgi:hypothetical protein